MTNRYRILLRCQRELLSKHRKRSPKESFETEKSRIFESRKSGSSKCKLWKNWYVDDLKVHKSNFERYHHILSLVWSFFGYNGRIKKAFSNGVWNIRSKLPSIFFAISYADWTVGRTKSRAFRQKTSSREKSRMYLLFMNCRQSRFLLEWIYCPHNAKPSTFVLHPRLPHCSCTSNLIHDEHGTAWSGWSTLNFISFK